MEMGHGHKKSCVLCQRSDETKVTGPLSAKGEVTAHQNCLLFSSGIYCRDSPRFHDLFGFSVEDVVNEVKRGNRLICSQCKKKGATAGCEIGRCKRTYHYPCAVEAGAKIIEDTKSGSYGLYCPKHLQKENNSSVNGCASSLTKAQTSENPSKAGPSKVYCLACEKTEGNISLETLSNSIYLMYCDKHAPPSHKGGTSGDSTAAELSVCSSDSSCSSSSRRHLRSKRRLSFNDKLEETSSKRKSAGRNRIISDDDDSANEPDADLAVFAPLESDLDGSGNSESILNGKDTEGPTGPASGNQQEKESRGGSKDRDETDAGSENVLPPAGSSAEPQPPSPTSAALTACLAASATRPTVILRKGMDVVKGCGEGSSPRQHTAGPSVQHQHQDLEPLINSSSFWKRCNAAGCTQAIFADFVDEMNNIASRIQSDQASREDYDLALTVMKASGKLEELVAKQQKELQRKQMELQKAAAAMKDVVSLLR